MVAGATAYYFAKKDINAHRRQQELKGVRGTEFLECTAISPSDTMELTITGWQVIERGQAAKTEVQEVAAEQDKPTAEKPRKKRSHEDKLA